MCSECKKTRPYAAIKLNPPGQTTQSNEEWQKWVKQMRWQKIICACFMGSWGGGGGGVNPKTH